MAEQTRAERLKELSIQQEKDKLFFTEKEMKREDLTGKEIQRLIGERKKAEGRIEELESLSPDGVVEEFVSLSRQRIEESIAECEKSLEELRQQPKTKENKRREEKYSQSLQRSKNRLTWKDERFVDQQIELLENNHQSNILNARIESLQDALKLEYRNYEEKTKGIPRDDFGHHMATEGDRAKKIVQMTDEDFSRMVAEIKENPEAHAEWVDRVFTAEMSKLDMSDISHTVGLMASATGIGAVAGGLLTAIPAVATGSPEIAAVGTVLGAATGLATTAGMSAYLAVKGAYLAKTADKVLKGAPSLDDMLNGKGLQDGDEPENV